MVLAAGFGTAWLLISLWLGTTILDSGTGGESPRVDRLVVERDGTPLIQSYPANDYTKATLRRLDGGEATTLQSGESPHQTVLAGESSAGPASFQGESWASRLLDFINEREPNALWYFVQDGGPRNSGYFVGYERVSNRIIGYIGLAGLREGPIPPDERIPANLEANYGYSRWSSIPSTAYSSAGFRSGASLSQDVPSRLVHIPSGDILRVVDLGDRTVRTVFKAPEPIVSVAVPFIAAWSGSRDAPERPVLVRTAERIYKLDHAYKVIGTVTIPAEVDRRAQISWFDADDGRAVATWDRPSPDFAVFGSASRSVIVHEIAADGAIRKTTEVELRNGASVGDERTRTALAAVCLPGPALLAGVEAMMAMEHTSRGYFTALVAILRHTLPAIAVLLAFSAALATAAWLRCRAFGLPARERTAWAAFVLLFGLPAWAGFRLHRRWPVREVCSRCAATSPRDRPACASCGEPFAAPTLKGTEIFA